MVKLLRLFVGVVVFFVLCVSPAANAELRIVGVSRSGDTAQTLAAIAGWAERLAPGDKMMILVARTRVLIGTTIAVPDDPTMTRPKRKLPYILPTLVAAKAYLEAPPSPGVDESVIDASGFLDEIAPTIADHNAEGVRIVLIGGPWFTAPGSLERSDYRQTWPSDGLIYADRSRSPIGTQGRHDLVGSVDYCITTGPTTFQTTEQRDRFERAWGLLISARGGRLTTFTTNTKDCYDRFAQAKAPDGRSYASDGDDVQAFAFYKAKDPAPEIRDAPPVKTAQPPLQPASARQEEAARFAQTARTTPPSTLTGPAWAGIQWAAANVDLDIYVRCSANAPFLFFANQHSYEGRHNYDYRVGTGSAFETVDLTQPCPDISKAQILVNFYEGRVGTPVNGVVAIKFDGEIYRSNFTMPALYGNGGRGLTASGHVAGNPFWVEVDVPALLHLTGAPQRHTAR